MTATRYQSDNDLQNIILHIYQDNAEKVDEIEVRMEEEFKAEKIKEIFLNMDRIDNEYDRKERHLKRGDYVFKSKAKNISRLKMLTNRYFHVEDVENKARERLANKDITPHMSTYKEILRGLIMQGLCKLMERNVIVRVRDQDQRLVQEVLREVETEYEKVTGLPVTLILDKEVFLLKSTEGGVILYSQDGSVSLDNTLTARLNMVVEHLIPDINLALFGGGRRNSQGTDFQSWI